MNGTDKKLVSHASIYFVGNVLRYSASFVMLPIYTRILTPADYGTIELLSTFIDVAGMIFGLRIDGAIFRFYLMTDSDVEKKNIISTALILLVSLNMVGFFTLYATSDIFSKLLFGGLEQQNLITIFSLSLLFLPVVEIPMAYIRAQQKPLIFVFFSLLKLLLQLSLNIYLLVILKLGVLGVVLSATVSGGTMSLLLGGYCLQRTGLKFSFFNAKKLVLFSGPMILASLISFYVTFGDRFFLKFYGRLEDVGLYALGYKFGFFLNFIGFSPFLSIWDSERYLVIKRTNAKEIFQNVFIILLVFSTIIAVAISIFSKNAIMFMANHEFWGSIRIVPLIVLAYFFQGMESYCNLGILIHKKTFIIAKASALAAVFITFLYFLLIPAYGAVGAAWATALTSALRFLYIYFNSTLLYDMELPYKNMFIIFPFATLAVLISLFGSDQVLMSLGSNIAVFCLFIYSFTLLPVLTKSQQLYMRNAIFRPWKIYSIINNFYRNL